MTAQPEHMPIERIRVTLLLAAKQGVAVRTGVPVAPQAAATIALDGEGNPYIPATTLKGALRAAYQGEDAKTLFGTVSEKQGDVTSGAIGAVLFDHAFSADAREKVIERRRTAIDRRRGAAEQNKLFAGQIAVGVTFRLELSITVAAVASGKERFKDAARCLGALLSPLADGLAVGSGTRTGLGRLTYAGINEVQVLALQDGALAWREDRDLHEQIHADIVRGRGQTSAPIRLMLEAERDYSSIDSAASTNTSGDVQIKLARDADGRAPLLTGASVMGALRSRAAWLAEIDWLRGNGAGFVPPARDRDTDTADDRFRTFDLKRQKLDQLSSVERLFGVPGWAGLLRIAELGNVRAGATCTRVNVAIDRLSGGALDTALFHTDVSRMPQWALSLGLEPEDQRPHWTPAMQKVDKALLTRLIEDLAVNGLALGHGAAKGLGWMKVRTDPVAEEGTSHG